LAFASIVGLDVTKYDDIANLQLLREKKGNS